MPPNKRERYYSAGEVAQILGIHRSGVWYHTRRLGLGQKIGATYMYTEKDIQAIRLHTRSKEKE